LSERAREVANAPAIMPPPLLLIDSQNMRRLTA